MPKKPKCKWCPCANTCHKTKYPCSLSCVVHHKPKPRPYRPTKREIEAALTAFWENANHDKKTAMKEILIAANKARQEVKDGV